ncbi:MAG TPA: glucose 1-dehydrogenase [Candidatus Dormibacteraeota bacterium]|jgi:glucose 1-dehydrogenase|nr:glucose 1-dehydrogenase [Candidatus Dormibacteraeota bacterium]
MLLEGRRTLITGASSGIGRATALRFGSEGALVCVNYYSDREKADADAVCAAIDGGGTRAFSRQADVGDEAQVVAMVAAVVERFGGIDVLVNNAGIEKQVPTLEMPLDLWNAVLRTNLTGAFLCLREAGKHMAAQKSGVVVNMSSVHEFIPWPGFAHYCASKGGMKLLTQTVAREWAPLGIRCVNVAPGAIATPINDFVLDDPEAKHTVEEEIPLGRFGQPEEIAGAVAWVASDQGGYVTGTTLVVDGGMSTYPKFV